MLRQLATTKGRRPSSSNSHVLEDIDETSEQQPLNFQDRRKKNNEAAKRSRDTRRAKEDEIAIRAAFLEQGTFKNLHITSPLCMEGEYQWSHGILLRISK